MSLLPHSQRIRDDFPLQFGPALVKENNIKPETCKFLSFEQGEREPQEIVPEKEKIDPIRVGDYVVQRSKEELKALRLNYESHFDRPGVVLEILANKSGMQDRVKIKMSSERPRIYYTARCRRVAPP